MEFVLVTKGLPPFNPSDCMTLEQFDKKMRKSLKKAKKAKKFRRFEAAR